MFFGEVGRDDGVLVLEVHPTFGGDVFEAEMLESGFVDDGVVGCVEVVD